MIQTQLDSSSQVVVHVNDTNGESVQAPMEANIHTTWISVCMFLMYIIYSIFATALLFVVGVDRMVWTILVIMNLLLIILQALPFASPENSAISVGACIIVLWMIVCYILIYRDLLSMDAKLFTSLVHILASGLFTYVRPPRQTID